MWWGYADSQSGHVVETEMVEEIHVNIRHMRGMDSGLVSSVMLHFLRNCHFTFYVSLKWKERKVFGIIPGKPTLDIIKLSLVASRKS